MRYVLTTRSRQQLAEIRVFYRFTLELPYVAHQETNQILEAIDRLTRAPMIDYPAPFNDHPDVRRLPLKHYVIYYVRNGRLVVILEICWSRADHERDVHRTLAA